MMYRRSMISRWIQEELTAVHDQLKQAVEDNRKKRELNDKYVGKLQETILSKEKEITVLKKKIDEYNPEEMKRLLLEEADKNYQATAERLEAEIDAYREQYNRLHYEHAILKCQLQYMETEQSRTLEEMRLKYLTEVLQLKETIENLIEKQNSPQEDNSAQLRIASREVMLLKTKLKVSLAECEELQTQKEKISLQMDSMARNYSNRLAESVANTRAIESEKSKIAMQNDSFQKELSLCLDHKRKLNSELQFAVEEVLTLQSQLEDCEHRYQLKVNNLQMEIVRLKGENEAEKESLMEELRKLKLEKDILEGELGHQKQSASEKQQNFQQQLQMASEHVRKKYNDLDYEKDKLERRLRDLELSKLDAVSQLHKELDSTKQQLQHVLEEKVENDKQLLLLKTTLDAHNRRNEELLHDDLVKHKAALRSEVNVLKEKVELLSMQNKELLQQSDKQISENLTHQKSQIVRKEAESEEHFNQRLSMEQQKFKLLQRIGELEMQLKEKHKDAEIEKRELQNKLKLNDRLLRKLRQKLSVLQAREIELQISTEILKKNVPVEVHSRVKKELLELQRKQAEFHQIMTSATRYALPLNNVNTEMNNLKISDRKIPFTPLPSEMTANVETSSVIPFKGNDHETDLGNDIPSKRKTLLKRRLLRFPRKIKSAVQLYSSSSDLENSSQVLDFSSSSIN